MNELLNQILLSLSEIPDKAEREKEAVKILRSIKSKINWEQFLQEIRRSIKRIKRKRLRKTKDDELLILLVFICSWVIDFLQQIEEQKNENKTRNLSFRI